MDAASLIKLAAARGIDLNHVAGVASRLDGKAAERRLSAAELKFRKENKLGLDVYETVKGRETRTYRRPNWSGAELGQAAKGQGLIPWNAALDSIAGFRDNYWLLWNALSGEAYRLSRREFWVPRVATEDGGMQFYRESLAQLILEEEANKPYFTAAPILYPAFMKVTLPVWERQLFGYFVSLKTQYDGWLGSARSWISKRICEPHRTEPVDNINACV